MYTESEFFEIIKDRTGREINDGTFGFIIGTMSPYIKNGMMSSINKEGYTIWKKEGNEFKELDTTTNSIELIIEFLNNTK